MSPSLMCSRRIVGRERMPTPSGAVFGCGQTIGLSFQLCHRPALGQKKDLHERKESGLCSEWSPERVDGTAQGRWSLAASQCFQDGDPKGVQVSGHIGTKMRAQHTTVAFC